jgi:hypothetical protein
MLSNQQLDKLSELFLDLSKGSFLAAFALPLLTGGNTILFIKTFILGLIFTFFSIKLISMKGEKHESH